MVGRCKFKLSVGSGIESRSTNQNCPFRKLVSALEAKTSWTAFKLCFPFQLVPLHHSMNKTPINPPRRVARYSISLLKSIPIINHIPLQQAQTRKQSSVLNHSTKHRCNKPELVILADHRRHVSSCSVYVSSQPQLSTPHPYPRLPRYS